MQQTNTNINQHPIVTNNQQQCINCCSHSQQSTNPKSRQQIQLQVLRQRQKARIEYFNTMKNIWKTMRVFVWNEMFNGNYVNQISNHYKLLFWLKYWRKNYFQNVAAKIFSFLDNRISLNLQPYLSSVLIPLLIMLFFNTKLTRSNYILSVFVIILYLLTVIIGPGKIKTQNNQEYTQALIKQKPFLNGFRTLCNHCEILRAFRSAHCPKCKQCYPKLSFHSNLMNTCIGAKNELLYLLFNISFLSCQLITISNLLSNSEINIFIKLLIIIFNSYIFDRVLVNALTVFISVTILICRISGIIQLYTKTIAGCNQHIQQNSTSKMHFSILLTLSVFALFNKDSQKPLNKIQNVNKKYITNWVKTLYISSADLVNHPHRNQIDLMNKQRQQMWFKQQQMKKRIQQNLLKQWLDKKPIKQILEMMQIQIQRNREQQKNKMLQMRLKNTKTKQQLQQKKQKTQEQQMKQKKQV